MLALALASVVDTFCVLRAPYPPDTVFKRHGVSARFLPIMKLATKVAITFGRFVSSAFKGGVAGVSTLGGIQIMDLTISEKLGKEHPFPPNQWVHKSALKGLGVELKDNPSWKDIGKG